MYDDVELGPIDSIRVMRAERKMNSSIKKMGKKNNEGTFVDFDVVDTLREDLLLKKKTRIATKDARKKYKELYGRKRDTLSLDDFVKEYLEKNGLKTKALPEPQMLKSEMPNRIPTTDMKVPFTEQIKIPKTVEPKETEHEYMDTPVPTENIDLISRKTILNNIYSIRTRNNNIGIEHFNPKNSSAKGYDTTRLIFGNEMQLDGHAVRCFRVSWYNSEDYMYGKAENMNGDYNKYIPILAEIDVTLLATNQDYANRVMTELLDKDRVVSFVNRGVQDRPDVLNGRYIGGVRAVKDESPKIFFNANVGREAHELPEMVKERVIKKATETNKEDPITAKRKELEEAENKVAQLRKELDEMVKKSKDGMEKKIETTNIESENER